MRRQIWGHCSWCNVYVPGISDLDSASLSYVWHFTCIASESVNSSHVIVLIFTEGLWFLYCCIVFVFLNVMFMLVCLKKLVSFLIFGQVARFLFLSLSCVWWTFYCFICTFRFVTRFFEKLLFCAMVKCTLYSSQSLMKLKFTRREFRKIKKYKIL